MNKSQLQREFVLKMQTLELSPEERQELMRIWFQVLIGATFDSETESWVWPEIPNSEAVMDIIQELEF